MPVPDEGQCLLLFPWEAPPADGIGYCRLHFISRGALFLGSPLWLPLQLACGERHHQGASGIGPGNPWSRICCLQCQANIYSVKTGYAQRQLVGSLTHIPHVVTNPQVFFGSDFITVTKNDDYGWAVLKPDIFAAITEFYSSGGCG